MPGRLQLFCAVSAVILGGVVGCARLSLDAIQADAAAGHGHLISEVPFIPQREFQCGPASLAMVLRYYGAAADAAEITHELYLPSIRGTLNLELEFYARRRGFHAQSFEGTLQRAKEELRRGHPLIVFQDLGLMVGSSAVVPVPHFAVLLGYDDRAGVVVLHSGLTPFRVLSYLEFERTWAVRRGWTLLISPKGQGTAGPRAERL